MPNLTGHISFEVKFDFTGITPVLLLTASANIPDADKPNLIGDFYVATPDGLQFPGEPGSVVWNGTGYEPYAFPLILCSDNTYQKGTYHVIFKAYCPGYTYGLFARIWDMEYKPVTQTLKEGFDLFTPALKYEDTTVYSKGDYTIQSASALWYVTSIPGTITGTASTLFFQIGGYYYDSTYLINYTKRIDYLHFFYPWLTVKEKLSTRVTKRATIPPTMATMLQWLIDIKDARDAKIGSCFPYDALDKIFEEADGLYQFIRTRVCARSTDGLALSFDQFYNLTHNYQSRVYVNTNTVIPVYDFNTGCSGGSGGTSNLPITGVVDGGGANDPVSGLTTFQSDDLIGVGIGNRLKIEVDDGTMASYGQNKTFDYDITTGEITFTIESGFAWQTGSSLWINRNQ